jgi:hypothetical protein
MFKKITTALLSLAAVCGAIYPQIASAWGDGGHMMVASIAYSQLNPSAKAEVDRLLKISVAPKTTTKKTQDFVNAAHWADDVRGAQGYEFAPPLHFIDYPFAADDTPLPDDLPAKQNIVVALEQYVGDLTSPTATDAEKAVALRFVIHFVGDIHQPLHCESRISAKYPEGDRGGNDFMISTVGTDGKKHAVKLHSYWDSGIGSFPREGPQFAPPPLAAVNELALKIAERHPSDEQGWQTGGVHAYEQWAQESNDIAVKFAYKGLKEKQVPSKTYIAKATQVAEQRVAWAGYRLAALLNSIWPAS